MLRRLSSVTSFAASSRCFLFAPAARSEHGLATVFAAFVALFATVTTAATLTLASSDVNFDAVTDIVEGSINRASATLEVRGSVIARSEDGGLVSTLQVPLRLYGEGLPVSFALDDPQRLVIACYDGDDYDPDVAYTVEMLTGDGDDLLEPWETALLTINLASHELQPGEGFTLELSAPVGGTVIVQRRLPPILQPVMSLY